MQSNKVTIAPGVTVLADDEVISMLNYASSYSEIYLDDLNLQQQAIVAKMNNKTLLIKRRKNGKVSYRIRPGISWK